MALPLAAILKAMPAILDATGAIMSSVRSRREGAAVAVKIEDRVQKNEDDLLALASALSKIAQDVQSLAQNLGAQAAVLEAQERRTRRMLWVSLVALAVALAAAVMASRGV